MQWGRVTPGKTTLTDARGAGRPGIASELSTLAPALVCGGDGARVRGRGVQGRAGRVGWCGVQLDETPCAREGAGRLAPHKHAPTQGEATAADTRASGPGRKMAARHSPVTPPPSPPHWPAGSCAAARRFPVTRRPERTLRRRSQILSPDAAPLPGSLTTRTSGVTGSPGHYLGPGYRKSRLAA